MSSNIRILIKIYYICPIVYLIRYVISRINYITSGFILIILLYFKFSLRDRLQLKLLSRSEILDGRSFRSIISPYYFSSTLFILLPADIFSNKLAHNVPSNILRKSSSLFFCFILNCFTNSF